MALLDAQALALALRLPLDEAFPAYRRARRWHLGLYQALSAAFTPQYQSHSRALPALRDHVLSPLSRLWPLPGILSALVSGDLIPPVAGQPRPAPAW
jgi:2-polyprenyl-6-methoxyphenol hydroxylase-like FAD-dependent oxidoreductase